ncbi:hypothetical protein Ppa06_35110 [Planomonospora parontospora subsp. parontospora]|uniref:Uncharacterized protein n=1 Tax=Planomonospora parontospora subsp. parontospora TaxID=97194 RepID=A0ABQ4HC47_9ACTN|nr:hypothetical protein Ppa06_35110 [Planomonospora parontospora subsp. parontospora]
MQGHPVPGGLLRQVVRVQQARQGGTEGTIATAATRSTVRRAGGRRPGDGRGPVCGGRLPAGGRGPVEGGHGRAPAGADVGM